MYITISLYYFGVAKPIQRIEERENLGPFAEKKTINLLGISRLHDLEDDLLSQIIRNGSKHLLLGVIHHVHHFSSEKDEVNSSIKTNLLARNSPINKPSTKGFLKSTSEKATPGEEIGLYSNGYNTVYIH